MKFCTVAAVLLVSLFATSMAYPARLSYYQQPSFYYQSRSSPQRLMYLQYVQQPSSSQTHARLTNAAAAFVAGETVATGTFLKDDASDEQQIAEESILDNTGANAAHSIAEAYPAGSAEHDEPQDDALENQVADAAEIAESEVPEVPEVPEIPEDNQVLDDEPAPADAEETPSEDAPETGRGLDAETPAEAAPEPAVAPVDLPEEAVNDDDEESDEDLPVVPSTARRNVGTKAAPAPLPAGTFFPIDFGGASGGAIAIANSLSTGVSGSAKSQAIAYGRPEPTRSRSRPVRRH